MNCQNIKFALLNQTCSACYTVGVFGVYFYDITVPMVGSSKCGEEFYFNLHIDSKLSLVKIEIYEH